MNPILWEKAIQVMLGVPLLTPDRLLGVLHVGRLENRPFTDHDLVLLQVAARTRARSKAKPSRSNAPPLRSWTQPPTRPATAYPGLEPAARYVPAEGEAIGGDWYDVFTLPSQQLWIVVGDVAGHGVNASIVMGRIRSASAPTRFSTFPRKRSCSSSTARSCTSRSALRHRRLRRHGSPYDNLTITLAGHPPPVIAAPNRSAEVAAIRPGPPLGCGDQPIRLDQAHRHPRHHSPPLHRPPGRTARRMDRRRHRRLRTAISPAHPSKVTADLMHQLVGKTVPHDDIALVVLRKTAPPTGHRPDDIAS